VIPDDSTPLEASLKKSLCLLVLQSGVSKSSADTPIKHSKPMAIQKYLCTGTVYSRWIRKKLLLQVASRIGGQRVSWSELVFFSDEA
jgi:hypothetical protein